MLQILWTDNILRHIETIKTQRYHSRVLRWCRISSIHSMSQAVRNQVGGWSLMAQRCSLQNHQKRGTLKKTHPSVPSRSLAQKLFAHMLSRFCPRPPLQVRWLTLPAANFQHILDNVGETTKPYMDDPLSGMSPYRRGQLLKLLGWKLFEESKPACKLEVPDKGAGWDFTISGRKVKFRSSQLAFEKCRERWCVRFRSIKLAYPGARDAALFDDLYLLIYSPAGIDLLQHDLKTGLSTDGIRTIHRGHIIHVNGQAGKSWREALAQILDKLTLVGSCKLVSHIGPSDPILQGLQSSHQTDSPDHVDIYKGVPWSKMNPMLRGLRVQEIACLVDQAVHPWSFFHEHVAGNSPADWIRDGVRVEVKHAKMTLGKTRILCAFSGIKMDLFDELWLVIYSPFGLHMFKHEGAGLSIVSGYTSAVGRNIVVTGLAHQQCPREALETMKEKLQNAGCSRVAEVLW